MKEDRKTNAKKDPQQRPEDAEKQNAQQEREYRKQKNGTMEKSPENTADEEAREKYSDIISEQKKDKSEEE